MTPPLTLQEREWQLYNELLDMALTDPEQFRLGAKRAYERYKPNDRRIIAGLEKGQAGAYEFFSLWLDHVHAVFVELDKTAVSKTFARTVAKGLVLDEHEQDGVIARIMSDRRQAIVDGVLAQLYSDSPESREVAAAVLSQPADEIRELYNIYAVVRLHEDVARQQEIVLYDPHASLWRRLRQKRAIKRERFVTAKLEKRRLDEIQRQIIRVNSWHESLLTRVAREEIDVIAVLAAKAQYDKYLEKLPSEQQGSFVEREKIYHKVMAPMRGEYSARRRGSVGTLAAMQRYVRVYDDIVIEMFELSNQEKNKLLANLKIIRDREKERAALEQAREKREAVEKIFYRP